MLFDLGYHQCSNDEYPLGSKCIKIFQEKQTWNIAQEKCFSIGARLIHLSDIVQEKKLTHFLSTNSEQFQQQTSFWISDDKDQHTSKTEFSIFIPLISFVFSSSSSSFMVAMEIIIRRRKMCFTYSRWLAQKTMWWTTSVYMWTRNSSSINSIDRSLWKCSNNFIFNSHHNNNNTDSNNEYITSYCVVYSTSCWTWSYPITCL